MKRLASTLFVATCSLLLVPSAEAFPGPRHPPGVYRPSAPVYRPHRHVTPPGHTGSFRLHHGARQPHRVRPFPSPPSAR